MQRPLFTCHRAMFMLEAHVVLSRCRHGYHLRFNRLAPQATPIEVRAGVIHGHDETPLPTTRKGRPRASGNRSESTTFTWLAQPADPAHPLYCAGEGRGRRGSGRRSPSTHGPTVSPLQTRAPGPRTGIAAGHHPAANPPVTAQTRRETTGSASDLRDDRLDASREYARAANTPSVPESCLQGR